MIGHIISCCRTIISPVILIGKISLLKIMRYISRTMRLLVMPKLSPTMTKGKLTSLFLKDMQAVSCHDVVFEVATDTLLNTSDEHLVMDIEVIEDMYVARVFEKAGETLKVGRPIALLCDNLADIAIAQSITIPEDYSIYDEVKTENTKSQHEHIPMAMWQAYAQAEVEGCK